MTVTLENIELFRTFFPVGDDAKSTQLSQIFDLAEKALPDQLTIRDAEVARRALDMAAQKIKHEYYLDASEQICKDILALRPAPTGWKLVPDQREFICKKCYLRTEEGEPENYPPF